MLILSSIRRALQRQKPRDIQAEVRERNLTYLSEDKFESLQECLSSLSRERIKGDFIEFGVALGGSGIFLARQLGSDRAYYGLDVFGMIPPPSAVDGDDVRQRYENIVAGKSGGINGDEYYGYQENLYDRVKSNFSSFGLAANEGQINLVKGLFSETIPTLNVSALALAHIDCDWYEPVKECLAFSWEKLSVGGFIALDDYNDWSGCATATDEFLREHPTAILLRTQPHAIITKAGH